MEKEGINLEFWDKIKYIISNPTFFFERIKDEESIWKSLLMYIMVGAFFSFTGFVFSNLFMTFLTRGSGLRMVSGFFMGGVGYSFIYFFIFGIIATFVYSGFMHALIKAFKSDKSYKDTYNVYTYSMLPYLALSTIPIIGYFAIIYSLVLMVIGIRKVHNLSIVKSILVCLLPGIILFLGLVGLLIILLWHLPI